MENCFSRSEAPQIILFSRLISKWVIHWQTFRECKYLEGILQTAANVRFLRYVFPFQNLWVRSWQWLIVHRHWCIDELNSPASHPGVDGNRKLRFQTVSIFKLWNSKVWNNSLFKDDFFSLFFSILTYSPFQWRSVMLISQVWDKLKLTICDPRAPRLLGESSERRARPLSAGSPSQKSTLTARNLNSWLNSIECSSR